MVSHESPHKAVPSDLGVSDEGWSPRLLVSFVGLVIILETLTISFSAISMSLPALMAHFHTTQSAWLLSSFLLVGTAACAVLGKLADVHGKRKMLLFAIGVAIVGCLVSALAPTFLVVIIGRGLQGFLVPVMFLSYSLMRDVYPPKILPFAVSVQAAGMGLITIPSPWLVGWLIDTWGFRSIFWFFLVILIVAGTLVRLSTDETTLRVKARVDYLGAVLLAVGLALVLAGVSLETEWGGWTTARTLGCIIAGALVLAFWVVSALKSSEPLVDIRYFRRRPIIMTSLAAGFVQGQATLFATVLPLLASTPAILGLGYGFGLDAKGLAILIAPTGLGCLVGGVTLGTLVKRGVNAKTLMVMGAVLMSIAALLVAFEHDAKGTLVIWALLQGLGQGLCYAAVPNIIIDSVAPTLQGQMSSMAQVFQSGIPAILPVVAFTVLNNGKLTVVQGNIFYSEKTLQVGFLIAAGCTLVTALTALAIPRLRTDGAEEGLKIPEPAREGAAAIHATV